MTRTSAGRSFRKKIVEMEKNPISFLKTFVNLSGSSFADSSRVEKRERFCGINDVNSVAKAYYINKLRAETLPLGILNRNEWQEHSLGNVCGSKHARLYIFFALGTSWKQKKGFNSICFTRKSRLAFKIASKR